MSYLGYHIRLRLTDGRVIATTNTQRREVAPLKDSRHRAGRCHPSTAGYAFTLRPHRRGVVLGAKGSLDGCGWLTGETAPRTEENDDVRGPGPWYKMGSQRGD